MNLDAPSLLSLLLGAAVLMILFVDVVRTSLSAHGAGPLLAGLSAALWQFGLWLHHRRPSHRMLASWGVLVLLSGFLLWGLLLWTGWTLVFLTDPQGVVDAVTRQPAGVVERIYYVGFSISTLGVGDFVANGPIWQVLTVAAASSGFFMFTLGVSYLLSVLPALARKRAVANYLSALGGTPRDLIGNQWREGSCERLGEHVPTLMQLLEMLSQEHAAFPILHYFHARERNASLPLRLAALSECLLYLESGAVDCKKAAFAVRPLRRSLGSMLGTLEELYMGRSDDLPPLPRIETLPNGVRVDRAADLDAAAGDCERQRRALLRYVRNEGWQWEDVYAPA